MAGVLLVGGPAHLDVLRKAGIPAEAVRLVLPEHARVWRAREGVTARPADGGLVHGEHLILAGDLRVCLAALQDATHHEQKLLGAISPGGTYDGDAERWGFAAQLAAIGGERHTWHLPGPADRGLAEALVARLQARVRSTGDGPRRVAILGAGAAGLSMARMVEQAGHHATVYEVSPRIGGKCESIRVGRVWHDVGGCFSTPDYHIFHDWLRERAMEMAPVGERLYLTPTGETSSMYKTALGEEGLTRVGVASLAYIAAWYRQERRARRAAEGRLTSEEHEAWIAELATPASTFFAAHKLDALLPVFRFMMTGLGYEYFDRVPMLYVYRWVGPEKMLAAGAEGKLTHELAEGFELFWQAIAHPLWDLRLGTTVTQVDRDNDGVTIRAAASPGRPPTEARYDAVVVACPLGNVPFTRRTPLEERVIGATRTMDYVSLLARIRNLAPATYIIRERLGEGHEGHVSCMRTTSGEKLRDPEDDEVFIAYAYANTAWTDDALRTQFAEDLSALGAQLVEVLTLRRWVYFPHFGPDDVASGLHLHLDAAQGANHTWYSGAVASFESNDNLIDHTARLLPRMERALASTRPPLPYPATRAEATAYGETSRHADVMAFIDVLAARQDPRLSVTSFGTSGEGRELPLLVLSGAGVRTAAEARALGRPIVLYICGIHAGEVEGKEAVLRLCRELLDADPTGLLDQVTLLVVPLFNPDGNDRIDPANRRLDLHKLEGQVGPDSGVGTRVNATGINLNRDYLKQQAPEMRLLQSRVCQVWRPDLTVDCHATNGSVHRFAMTVDIPHTVESGRREPILYMREQLVPAVKRAVKEHHGLDSGWYGNFVRDEDTIAAGAPVLPDDQPPTAAQEKGWITYPHHPRFGSNYRGLTNRLDLLLEAYSYLPFPERVRTTWAWLRETLCYVAAHGPHIRALVDACRMPPDQVAVRYRLVTFEAPVEILTRQPRTLGGAPVSVTLPHWGRFVGTIVVERPTAYAVPEVVAAHLALHGVTSERLGAAQEIDVEVATVRGQSAEAGRVILEAASVGEIAVSWHRERRTLPEGTLLVPTEQTCGAIVVYLCEPESDDGVVECGLLPAPAPGTEFPILRVHGALPHGDGAAVARSTHVQVRAPG